MCGEYLLDGRQTSSSAPATRVWVDKNGSGKFARCHAESATRQHMLPKGFSSVNPNSEGIATMEHGSSHFSRTLAFADMAKQTLRKGQRSLNSTLEAVAGTWPEAGAVRELARAGADKNGAGGGNRTHGLGIMRPSLFH